MTDQAKKVARAELATRLFVLGLVAVVVVMAGFIVQIRTTQLDGTPLGKKLITASDRILDCTDPDGACTVKNQKQTAQLVGEIGTGNILAVVCALQVPNGTPLNEALTLVTDCVAKRLADRKP